MQLFHTFFLYFSVTKTSKNQQQNYKLFTLKKTENDVAKNFSPLKQSIKWSYWTNKWKKHKKKVTDFGNFVWNICLYELNGWYSNRLKTLIQLKWLLFIIKEAANVYHIIRIILQTIPLYNFHAKVYKKIIWFTFFFV